MAACVVCPLIMRCGLTAGSFSCVIRSPHVPFPSARAMSWALSGRPSIASPIPRKWFSQCLWPIPSKIHGNSGSIPRKSVLSRRPATLFPSSLPRRSTSRLCQPFVQVALYSSRLLGVSLWAEMSSSTICPYSGTRRGSKCVRPTPREPISTRVTRCSSMTSPLTTGRI